MNKYQAVNRMKCADRNLENVGNMKRELKKEKKRKKMGYYSDVKQYSRDSKQMEKTKKEKRKIDTDYADNKELGQKLI